MKRVKVFIASSAELDDDKKELDFFFAERNKIYAERNILFIQKTWKDFESSLHKHFLQDRYNDYIRKCDIVIFLFHTKLGKYTLQELDIADETFKKSRKRKPRIFIFYKETPEQQPELADFKRLSKEKYGHFCDTYENYDELLQKMEKQLQLLENTGEIIHPILFDPRKWLRYLIFYFILPVLMLVAVFMAFHYYSDIDMRVRVIEDAQTRIPSIPFDAGTLEITYGNGEMKSFKLDAVHQEAIIKDIHSKFRGEMSRIRFTAPGYANIDTMAEISENIQLTIRRNDDLRFIFGSISDEYGNPLDEVIVTVQDITVKSNEAGNFRLEIPVAKQAKEQLLTAYKPGYERWTFTAPVMSDVPWSIVLKKSSKN